MRRALVAALLTGALGTGALMASRRSDAFPHPAHARLFPGSCATCHAGAANDTASMWPMAAQCTSCHDGEVKPRVTWTGPRVAPATLLRFTHAPHRRATADSVSCRGCHADGTTREVVLRDADRCVACHVPGVPHLAAPARTCATCHVTLVQAASLDSIAIARLPVPPSHRDPGFGTRHGRLAAADAAPDGVNASCATCHARNFCMNCHVDAPDVPTIRALALDTRNVPQRFTLRAPPSHQRVAFATKHAAVAAARGARCGTCHTRESCTACHVAPTRAVAAMPGAAADRAPGVTLARQAPASHVAAFRDRHAAAAAAAPRSCTTCHVREDCLSCHREPPAAGGAGRAYHPTGFIPRHPAAAYARQSSCADCHNTQQFCASCHRQAGLGGGNTLAGARYHDAQQAFGLGHGKAARQGLESCVSCHAERDCTGCHAAVGGRRFSPHGPGFDGERLRRRNPEMCTACHGREIPTARR